MRYWLVGKFQLCTHNIFIDIDILNSSWYCILCSIALLCLIIYGLLTVFFSRCFCIVALFGRRQARCSGGIGRGRLYISQTCANMLSTYDLACKVPLLILMLVCIRAGFCFELGWVREPELEFVLTNYADLNVVI